MTTSLAVFEAVRDQLLALNTSSSLVRRSSNDVFRLHEGPVEAMPAQDRVFIIDIEQPPTREGELGSCKGRFMLVTVGRLYKLTDGHNARRLADADLISLDAVPGLRQVSGIIRVDDTLPASSEMELIPGTVLDLQSYGITYRLGS